MAEDSNKGFHLGGNPPLEDKDMVSFHAVEMNDITGIISGINGISSHAGPISAWDPSVNDTFARIASGASSSFNSRPGYNLELATNWSPDEDAILKKSLVENATEEKFVKYIKIAAMLDNKTVRDVALRCRWIIMNGKKYKSDEACTGKKMKYRKVVDCSSKLNICNVTSDTRAMNSAIPHDFYQNDQFSCEGPTLDAVSQQILLENSVLFHQVRVNFSSLQIADNTGIFVRTRNNLLEIVNRMNQMPGIMSNMPPLPPVNEELLRYLMDGTTQAFTSSNFQLH